MGQGASSVVVRQVAERIRRACAIARPPEDVLERVAELVRPVLRQAGAGWMLLDPVTVIPTGGHMEGCAEELHLALMDQEHRGRDLNLMRDLAATDTAASTLSGLTGGDLARCRRWREVYRTHGYGDEIRGVFASAGTVWAGYTAARHATDEPFGRAETELMAGIAPHVAAAVRHGLVLRHLGMPGPPDIVDQNHDAGPAGVVVLGPGGRVVAASATAQSLLDDLAGGHGRPAPGYAVHEVAARARALAGHPPVSHAQSGHPLPDHSGSAAGAPGPGPASGLGSGTAAPPAVALAQTRGGAWRVLRAACLDGPGRREEVAVVIEPAPAERLHRTVMDLHGLTPREREIALALLGGADTALIARQLWISADTVRGHLKAVFGKVGVRSRPELLAVLDGRATPHAAAGWARSPDSPDSPASAPMAAATSRPRRPPTPVSPGTNS